MRSLILNKILASFLFLSILTSSCLAMDKNDKDDPLPRTTPSCTSTTASDIFNLQPVVTEIYASAKTCSDNDSSINLSNVCQTLNLFTLTNTTIIFDHIVNTFFIKDTPFECLASINVHTLKKAEDTLKINLFKQVIALTTMPLKDTSISVVNQLTTLQRILPNFKNIEKLAKKKMLSDPKILKEMANVKALKISTFHLENVVKQLYSHGTDLTMEIVHSKFLEYLDTPLLCLVNTYLFAKKAEILPNFFLNAFSNGCKVVRLAGLHNWSLKYIYHMEEENDHLRMAKENAQHKPTTEFDYKKLNARIIYLASYICQLKNRDLLHYLAASKSKLTKLATNVLESLTDFEKTSLNVKEAGNGLSYVFNCINKFLDDYRD